MTWMPQRNFFVVTEIFVFDFEFLTGELFQKMTVDVRHNGRRISGDHYKASAAQSA